MKLNSKDKIKIVELCEKGLSQTEIAKMYNIAWETASRLYNNYKKNGVDGIVVKKHKREFSPEFKVKIIQQAKASENISALSREYNIRCGTLFN